MNAINRRVWELLRDSPAYDSSGHGMVSPIKYAVYKHFGLVLGWHTDFSVGGINDEDRLEYPAHRLPDRDQVATGPETIGELRLCLNDIPGAMYDQFVTHATALSAVDSKEYINRQWMMLAKQISDKINAELPQLLRGPSKER